MKKDFIVALVILFVLTSCGPAYYLKRAAINLKKAEQLGAKITPDTVYIDRKIIVHESHIDTVFTNVVDLDTLTLENTRVLTKVEVNYRDRKVYVQSKCKTDTIIQRIPVTITKTITAKQNFPWWIYAVMIAMGIVILFLAIKR